MHHLRVFDAGGGVYAFYDGRVPGYRSAEGPNWVDDGALSLGIASYAVIAGDEALVYDTHVSVEHASFIRSQLEGKAARKFKVVLSHWHLDHVAGTAVFADSEIIASHRTCEILTRYKGSIERGEYEGPPAIDPLIVPSSGFSDRLEIALTGLEVQLIQTNIHSDDATVVWLPQRGVLLCGDTMEDTVTYVDEPQSLDEHLVNLERLRGLAADRILPNHGDPQVIAAGGYGSSLIRATEQYISVLQDCCREPGLRDMSLRELLAEPLEAGWIHYYPPYEAVHRHNVEVVCSERT